MLSVRCARKPTGLGDDFDALQAYLHTFLATGRQYNAAGVPIASGGPEPMQVGGLGKGTGKDSYKGKGKGIMISSKGKGKGKDSTKGNGMLFHTKGGTGKDEKSEKGKGGVHEACFLLLVHNNNSNNSHSQVIVESVANGAISVGSAGADRKLPRPAIHRLTLPLSQRKVVPWVQPVLLVDQWVRCSIFT